MGVIAAATGDTASKYVARRETPLYIPENCTQCMECISRLPGYGAAQLLAGSGHDPLARRLRATWPIPPSAERCSTSCRRSRSSRASACWPRSRRNAAAHDHPRSHRVCRRVLRAGQGAVLRHHRQGSHGLPEDERHLLLAGAQDSPARAASSPSSSAICARAARPASRPAAITRR